MDRFLIKSIAKVWDLWDVITGKKEIVHTETDDNSERVSDISSTTALGVTVILIGSLIGVAMMVMTIISGLTA